MTCLNLIRSFDDLSQFDSYIKDLLGLFPDHGRSLIWTFSSLWAQLSTQDTHWKKCTSFGGQSNNWMVIISLIWTTRHTGQNYGRSEVKMQNVWVSAACLKKEFEGVANLQNKSRVMCCMHVEKWSVCLLIQDVRASEKACSISYIPVFKIL